MISVNENRLKKIISIVCDNVDCVNCPCVHSCWENTDLTTTSSDILLDWLTNQKNN